MKFKIKKKQRNIIIAAVVLATVVIAVFALMPATERTMSAQLTATVTKKTTTSS